MRGTKKVRYQLSSCAQTIGDHKGFQVSVQEHLVAAGDHTRHRLSFQSIPRVQLRGPIGRKIRPEGRAPGRVELADFVETQIICEPGRRGPVVRRQSGLKVVQVGECENTSAGSVYNTSRVGLRRKGSDDAGGFANSRALHEF